MKKRIFSLVLCSALLLSGCGSKSQPVSENNKDTEVTESTVSDDSKDTEIVDSEKSDVDNSIKEVSDNTSDSLDDILKDIDDNSKSIRDTLDDINNPSDSTREDTTNSEKDSKDSSSSSKNLEETFITKFDGMNAMEEYNGVLEFFTDEVDEYAEQYDDYYDTPDSFLGYDCYYEASSEFDDISDDNLEGYSILVTFKDKDSYNSGQIDIANYLSKLSYDSEDLSSYKDTLSRAYICKDSKGSKYVVVPYKLVFDLNASENKDIISMFHNECSVLIVMDYNYYSNKFLGFIK